MGKKMINPEKQTFQFRVIKGKWSLWLWKLSARKCSAFYYLAEQNSPKNWKQSSKSLKIYCYKIVILTGLMISVIIICNNSTEVIIII